MVKKSIPEPFAPGSGRTVADALEPVLAKVRELREQGVGGPWVDVLDTLHAVYWALLTRNASEMVESNSPRPPRRSTEEHFSRW